ncbi:MAG TPA: hypothetical protein VFL49_03840 [Pseudolabrys sp.]|jgi:hypothetical protein|nr:hypothetical protein [Pseudolabrys sp.]
MKIVTRALFACAVALAAATPALAADSGMDHRMHASDAKRAAPATDQSVRDHERARRAIDSMAHEPAGPSEDYGYRYFHDFGIGSQS